jgi:hypothetical protein
MEVKMELIILRHTDFFGDNWSGGVDGIDENNEPKGSV